MAEEFDPRELLGDVKIGGIRKKCTDAKRCGLGNICEFAQDRGESVELLSLWGHRPNECENYTPRKELTSENDLFRARNRPKHNPLRRSNLLPNREPPDLNVTRHIRDGRDIKGDD